MLKEEGMKMKYGVSYYPEHKDQAEIGHDIALMKELGVNLARMGEFAWCKFEPREGEYDFAWLDPVIEQLGRTGSRPLSALRLPALRLGLWKSTRRSFMWTTGSGQALWRQAALLLQQPGLSRVLPQDCRGGGRPLWGQPLRLRLPD